MFVSLTARSQVAFCWLVTGLLPLGLVGCSGGPEPVSVPEIDPEAAADGALELYDQDGDSQLSLSELANSPPLTAALKRIDQNSDGNIDRTELVDRFSKWANGGVGAANLACRIIYKGRPLAGAKVEIIPEKYLADAFQPATGTTSRKGIATMAIDSAFLPSDLQRLKVVHQGLYRVVITHPEVDLPTKYNVDTELGLEVTFGAGKDVIPFDL